MLPAGKGGEAVRDAPHLPPLSGTGTGPAAASLLLPLHLFHPLLLLLLLPADPLDSGSARSSVTASFYLERAAVPAARPRRIHGPAPPPPRPAGPEEEVCGGSTDRSPR